MFFSCLDVINAYQFSVENTSDIYFNCKDNSCVPLCVYGNDDGLISYSVDQNEWSIAYKIVTRSGGGTASTSITYVKYEVDSRIPVTNIYWGSTAGPWTDTVGYKSLNDELKCPSYLYVDKGDGNELCFANDMGSCKDLNSLISFSTNFDDDEVLSLTRDFYSELNPVLYQTYQQMHFDEKASVGTMDKVKFIENLDENITYDNNLSVEENVINNCSYFQSELADGNAYVKKLMNSRYVDDYFNTLNFNLKEAASKNEYKVKNIDIYTYDILRNILVYKKSGVTYYRNPYFKGIDGVGENIANSLLYISSVCDDVNINIDVNVEDIKSKAQEIFNSKFYGDPIIEFDDEDYDCSFLSDISDLISTGYFIIEIVAVVILIVFSILDYAKVIMNGEADQMKKTNGKLFTRIVLVAVIFLLPAILNLVLKLFKIEGINSEHPLCVEIKK